MTGKLVAFKKGVGKHAASSISENSGNPDAERRTWPHHFYISSAVASHLYKVCSIVRRT